MEQQNTKVSSSEYPMTRVPWLLMSIVCLLIIIPFVFFGYRMGYVHGVALTSHVVGAPVMKKIKSATVPNASSTPASQPYTVSYLPPSGWRTMLWHPTSDSTQSAFLSPDYTSIFDPEPQTGVTILFYQYPQTFASMQKLRPYVEQTAEGLTALTQTTIGGFPAFHAVYVDSEDGRVLDDYDILKDHDHWEVRIILPYDNITDAKNEEQRYQYQITTLLQSIQFKPVQYE